MDLNIDLIKLKNLLKSFHTLTGMTIAIFDLNDKKLASYPDFDCKTCKIIQNTYGLKDKCFISNKASFEACKKSHSLYIYECHASLTEATAVLRKDNIEIGYIMIGQVSSIKNKKERVERIKKILNINSISKEFEESIMSIKYRDDEQIKSAAKILEALANYLILDNFISINKSHFVENIDKYIDDHIENKIYIDELAKHFGYGRTKFYEECNKFLDVSIGDYVINKKINYAKKLLISEVDLDIAQIAYDSGFNDENYFIRLFKKSTSLTPKKYREKYKK